MAAEARPKDSLRCHHCAGPLSKNMETSGWNLPPLIRDSFFMIGSAVGGTASAFYGFNHDFGERNCCLITFFFCALAAVVMPVVCRWVKGPMWLHFLIGAPPVIVFSSACAGLTGGAVPAFAQLASSTYHAAVSSHSPPSSTEDHKMHKSRASSTL